MNQNKIFIKKTLFLLFIFFLFRLGSHITVPSINTALIEPYLTSLNSDLMTMINTFSGGSAYRFSILLLGIMPYITASIIIQLMALFVPKLKHYKEMGEKGMIQINRYTKYLTFFIALFQSFIATTAILNATYLGHPLVLTDILSFYIISISSLVGGVFLVVWMAEKINTYGYGSGVSMMIFCGIMSSLPQNISIIKNTADVNSTHFKLIIFILMLISLFFIISHVENARRNIKTILPNSRDGESNYPVKINIATIMPAIFAFMVLTIPQMILQNLSSIFENFDFAVWWDTTFGYSKTFFWGLICALIFLFSKIYSKTTFNTKKIAESFRDSNIYIKGIRPNKPTIKYLSELRSRLTLISSFYLCIIVITPEIFNYFTGYYFYLGGISLLIMVTVAIDVKNNFDLNKRKLQIYETKEYTKKLFE